MRDISKKSTVCLIAGLGILWTQGCSDEDQDQCLERPEVTQQELEEVSTIKQALGASDCNNDQDCVQFAHMLSQPPLNQCNFICIDSLCRECSSDRPCPSGYYCRGRVCQRL